MEYLAYLAMLLLLGSLCAALAKRLGISEVFFLMLTGMVIGALKLMVIKKDVVELIAILALIFIVFDSTSRLKVWEIRKFSPAALRLCFVFFLLTVLFIGLASALLFGLGAAFALLFASLMYGIDPSVVLSVMNKGKGTLSEIMELESIINTPLTIIASLTAFHYIKTAQTWAAHVVFTQVFRFFVLVLAGLFVGGVLAFFLITILKKGSMGEFSYLSLITVMILAYVVAEVVGGSGVLAVSAFGVVFGRSHLKHKIELEKYASILSTSIRVLAFILAGSVLFVKSQYVIKGTLLFLAYLLVRFVSVVFSLSKQRLSLRERLFMTANVPKGLDVAVVLLILMSSNLAGGENMTAVINLSMLFILYSVALSVVVTAIFGGKKKQAVI